MAFGGFEQRGTQQPMAEINTTPLVDVMLVLLVIFIITAPLITHSVKLDLPRAKADVSSEPSGTVTVSIPANGLVHWNNEPLADPAALAAKLREAAGANPQPAVHLRADRDTRYQTIAEVMSAAQQAGIRSLGFVTESAKPAEPQSPERRGR
jgi:biopolymer transport protein ExbD